MKLQTTIRLNKLQENLIDHNAKIVLLGSCFSENIGERLQYFKFQTTQNPFGIFFHPVAINRFITDVINQKQYTEADIFYHQERWHCFHAHSSLSASDKNVFLHRLNRFASQTLQQLKAASHVIVTLGTSWVYRHIESDAIVANCHKIPQKKFSKELLTTAEISESLSAMVSLLKTVNKTVTVVFTISPIRHLKDGFVENTLSKAHLVAAVHRVIAPKKNSHYFPSYEFMMDELRDYRFYAEDLIHPNTTAINYIWEKFIDTWCTENTKPILKKIDLIQKGLAHQPFNESSEAHQQFLNRVRLQIKTVKDQFSFMEF